MISFLKTVTYQSVASLLRQCDKTDNHVLVATAAAGTVCASCSTDVLDELDTSDIKQASSGHHLSHPLRLFHSRWNEASNHKNGGGRPPALRKQTVTRSHNKQHDHGNGTNMHGSQQYGAHQPRMLQNGINERKSTQDCMGCGKLGTGIMIITMMDP